MRKSHILLLIIAVVLALSSAYSLAAINQVYKINFEWYSQYSKQFKSEQRETSTDSWKLSDYSGDMLFKLVSEKTPLLASDNNDKIQQIIKNTDFGRYILLDCSLGKVVSPDYRIKVIGIAQRGSLVEIKVSLNNPQTAGQDSLTPQRTYTAEDVVRISKSAFPVKGRLCFVFKNQDGVKLFENYYDIM
ncbi:MAG: hypothetical protein Q8920_15670 [Bacillota bacterium]|nr:hypothetical protein [Bacillota bacterium]